MLQSPLLQGRLHGAMELDFMFEANVFGFESSFGNFLLTHSQMQYHGENLSNSRIIVRVK